MIDSKEYCRIIGARSFNPELKMVHVTEIKQDSLTDDELIFSYKCVYGFSLVSKRWGAFFLQHIQDVEYNTTAFDSLMIPQHQKLMVRSLVNDHQNEHSTFDDLIQGKGKGLIFLLHGPPGVGKTLTAGKSVMLQTLQQSNSSSLESLAGFTRRPLCVLGCADLSGPPQVVEKALSRALQLSSRWNALILIDEADVFMEQRTPHNLFHNDLVAGTCDTVCALISAI